MIQRQYYSWARSKNLTLRTAFRRERIDLLPRGCEKRSVRLLGMGVLGHDKVECLQRMTVKLNHLLDGLGGWRILNEPDDSLTSLTILQRSQPTNPYLSLADSAGSQM